MVEGITITVVGGIILTLILWLGRGVWRRYRKGDGEQDSELTVGIGLGPHPPKPKEGRIPLHRTPRQLMQSIENMTTLNAAKFVRDSFAGKWLRLSGPIDDIASNADLDYAYLHLTIEGVHVSVELCDGEQQKVTHLQINEYVTVDCTVFEIDGGGVHCSDGELLPTAMRTRT